MFYILTIADRGLVSHAEAFRTRKAAEEGLVNYLRHILWSIFHQTMERVFLFLVGTTNNFIAIHFIKRLQNNTTQINSTCN